MELTAGQRRYLIATVATAFGLRMAWALYARGAAPVEWFHSGDQYSYYHYGSEMARGRGYISYFTGSASAYYPIGYPGLLAALYFVVLHTPIPDHLMMATALLHVVAGTASVWFVFLIGRSMSSVRTGLVAATLLAVFPNVIYQVSTVQLETVFIAAVSGALAVIVTHDWVAGPPSTRRLLAFGVALGAAILVRPFAAVLLVGLAGALLVTRVGWRRTALGVALPLAVVIAMSVPWTIRNAVEMHAFIPSSTNMGDTLCLDRNLDAQGGFRFADHDGCVDPGLPEVERNAGNTKKAIHFVIDHPGRELLQIGRRGRLMFIDDHDGIEAVQTLGGGLVLSPRAASDASSVGDRYFYGIVGLAVLGLLSFFRRDRRPQRLLVLSGLVGLLVIPLLLWGNPRFHLPLVPFIALSAASPIVAVWDRLRPVRVTADPATPVECVSA